ncbi:putative lysine-specific demethylase elf6 [Quercus suber]|uniref:Lysine-specific demethylase elf6 n=1 Tax=Quercus suber TaxID=58331 RepID=A0AAW0LAU7_QUESU
MGNVEIPNWLKGLPLAPEFRPTDTEFADPIAYISKIEKQASAFGICKIIPPLPKPSKKYVFCNLNKSFQSRRNWVLMHQELGQSVKRTKGAAQSPQLGVHKQVWQSGEIYSLEQFESKSKVFSRSILGMVKEVSPLVVEAMFWKATSEKPIYVEYANDIPGSGFGEPEGQSRYFHRRRRKRNFYQRSKENSDCKNNEIDSVTDSLNDEIKDSSAKNEPDISLETPKPPTTSSTLLSDDTSRCSRRKSSSAINEMEGTAGWKLSNSPWNLQIIARSPGSLTRFMPDDIPGVTSPMVYIGMLFSWFAWHVEDHELHSMNFLHTGSAKTWYAVPGDYAFAFEEVIRSEAYGVNIDHLAALTLLGEKTTLLSPEVVVASGIPCCRLVQNPGEFVVTFPRAYHVGFSHGFNCGEAANFGTPQWLTVAKEAAVRRAAMNYLPMLSHQQLLYLLTMSFVSRVPRSLLPGVRSSRLRDRQKEERELLVKKAFIEDILKENIKLSNLLGKVSTCHAVLWNADLLPYPSRDSQLPSIVATDSTSPRENASHIHTENNNNIQNDLIHEMNLYIETLNDLSLDGDDLSCDFQVDSGTLACVACGILGFPFMSVVQPSEEASLKLQPMDHRLVQGGPRVSGPENACSSPDCDGFIKSNIPENLPPVPDVSLPPKDLKMSLLTKFDTQWNTSSKFLRPRIFCLEHAIEIVELLQSKGGVNMLMICHSDYQKMKAHAVAVSEEIGKPFDYNEVPLDTASQEDLNLIDLAIDDEEHDECGEDWTSKLGINLRYCAKVRKNSPSMQVQHALTLGGLFSEKSATSECLTVKWQSRRSRSRKSNHSSHGKVCDTAQSKKDEVLGGRSNGIIVNNEKKLIQYSRRNPKLKLGGSTDASTVDGCPGKNLSKDVSAATYGDRDKQSGKATENDLSNKGNSKSDAVFVFSNASGVSEMQHESSGFAATSGGSLNSAPSRIEDSPASDTLVVVETQSENHTLDDFDIDGKACNVATWDGSEMQPKIKSTDETKEEDKTTYAKKCGSPLIIATDERSGMQAENQSKEKISITNESFHLVSEGQCNVSTEGDVLMNEVSDLSKPPTPHIADPVVRNFEAQMENVVLEESCINSKVLVCATLDNEVQQKIHTTSRIEYDGPLSSNVAPINQLTLASTEGVSCNIAVTNQPTLASMQESCEGPTEIRAAEDISIAMSSDAVEQELESENGSTEDEPVSSYVIPTNEPTASREIHSPDRNNEELVSSSVSPMEVSQPCVSLEQCPEVPRGCSAEEDLHDGVTLDTEVQQDIQTSDGTDEGMPVPSFITQVEKEPVTISGGECYKVPRGINAEENLSGGVALDNEVEQKKELTNENDEEFSEYDTLINPPSPAPIQKRSRIRRDTHVENLLHKEVCSSQDDRELESIESTLLEPRSSTDKRRKRKREADHLTENKFGCSDFIRSPCEGLRPRAGKDATSRCGIDTSKIVEEKLVRKKVSKASDVPLPPKNKNSMGSHKCDLEGCRMSFKTKAELLLHKRNRCPHEGCGKRFSNHKYAMLHKRVHDDDRPLKCPWKGCTMSFKWAWARTEHIRVHTGERPYKCKVEGCGLSFRFVSDYSRHRRKTGHYVNSPA